MNPFNFALVAVILAMALVMACGPGAGSEPAAPSDGAVATDAPMTAPADEGRAVVDGVQLGRPAMENSNQVVGFAARKSTGDGGPG